MSTNSKARAAAPAPITLTAEEKLRVYSAEEVEELKLLPVKARWLKEMAYKRRIPAVKIAGKLGWRLDHILAISLAGDLPLASEHRRAA